MTTIKKEMEEAAVTAIRCPSCKAEPGAPCHFIGHGGGLCRIKKVKTHQRRMSAFVATKVGFK